MADLDAGKGARRITPATAVVTYRAVVGVLLTLIGAMLWAMWNDISSRQQDMGLDIKGMNATLVADHTMIADHDRRIGDLEGGAKDLSGRVDRLEARSSVQR